MFLLVCLLFPVVFVAILVANHFAVKWNEKGASGLRGVIGTWADRKSSLISGVEVGTCLVSLALLVLLASALITGAGDSIKAPLFITSPGEASQQVQVTKREADRLPRYEYVAGSRIVRGKVSETMPVGGGLRSVCISAGDYCGLADSTLALNPGDTVYIHLARTVSTGRYGIVITEREARSLSGTGRYTIEDR